MTTKKTVKSIRIDEVLEARIASYATAAGYSEAEAIRTLLEQGLASESLSVFATPVGGLIRDVIEAEFNLLREDMDQRNEQLEERVARVCSKGTKTSLHIAAQLNDVSRAIIPAWRDTEATDLWKYYSKVGGELQSGRSYSDVKAGS